MTGFLNPKSSEKNKIIRRPFLFLPQDDFRCVPRPSDYSSGTRLIFSPNQFFFRGGGVLSSEVVVTYNKKNGAPLYRSTRHHSVTI